jgi:hypothetical protein
MGLPADAIAELPAPATAFPEPGRGAGRLDASRLVKDAYRRRADLAAADQDTRAAGIRLQAARSDLRPRFDLGLSTGYRATEADDGIERFFSTVNQHRPRLDALVELRLELPLSNSAARGQVVQRSAAHEQRQIARGDLRRRIAAGVAMGLEAVAAAAAIRESTGAVPCSGGCQAVSEEGSGGAATLFDPDQALDARPAHCSPSRTSAITPSPSRRCASRAASRRGDHGVPSVRWPTW